MKCVSTSCSRSLVTPHTLLLTPSIPYYADHTPHHVGRAPQGIPEVQESQLEALTALLHTRVKPSMVLRQHASSAIRRHQAAIMGLVQHASGGAVGPLLGGGGTPPAGVALREPAPLAAALLAHGDAVVMAATSSG